MKRPIDTLPNRARPLGYIGGTVKVQFEMHPEPVESGGLHPAEMIGNYVRNQVQHIMDVSGGGIPSEINVKFDIEE